MSLLAAELIVRPEEAPATGRGCGDGAVEVVAFDKIAAYRTAWTQLASRALEPDVFMEPDFALAVTRQAVARHRPQFLLIWAAEGDLIGLAMITPPSRYSWSRHAAAWTTEQATLSAPLLDESRAMEALDLLLDWLERTCGASGLMLRGVPLDGAWHRLLAPDGPYRTAVIDRRERAVLDSMPQAGHGGRHAKELRRQGRRLAERGALTFRMATSVEDVRQATERFLDLEVRGWKGRRGTALLLAPERVTFARAMTRMLARSEQCEIASLELDGRTIAMGIVLRSRDRAYFWKTAFDEAFAAYSPGKQLTVLLTEHLAKDARVRFADSCAVPNHPMIDQIWRDRMVVGDVLIALRPGGASAFRRSARLLSAWTQAWRGAKQARAMMKRVRSRPKSVAA